MSITCHTEPATDLGYLLHKNPARSHEVGLGAGKATVFYPEVGEVRTTASLLVELDPVGLVRRGAGGFALAQYVNDRPYTANSFLANAISRAFGTALNGRCRDRPELADKEMDLEAWVPTLVCPGGDAQVRRVFEPLGYAVRTEGSMLDAAFPDWGPSRYLSVRLRGRVRIKDLLAHLSVLVPAFDREKHYWVGDGEVEKLLRRGEGWLAGHPEREWIAARYLKSQRGLTNDALERLGGDELSVEKGGQKSPLHEARLERVLDEVVASGARSVVDMGCGEGKLLRRLLKETKIPKIVGMDVGQARLEMAADRLGLERMPEAQRGRIELLHGSLLYCDRRLRGFDVACLVEVVEHLDPIRLGSLERAVFGFARPRKIVLTTPNREYNVRYENLGESGLRHGDHRFEWGRSEFGDWCRSVADAHGYGWATAPVGEVDELVGAPSQMAVFEKLET